MYWSVWGLANNSGSIEKASMDGTGQETLHNTSLMSPYALTLDIHTQTLYWADDSTNKVEASAVNGSQRRTITTTGVNSPYAIAVLNSTLYLADRLNQSIAVIHDSEGEAAVLVELCGAPYALRVVDPSLQPQGEWHWV